MAGTFDLSEVLRRVDSLVVNAPSMKELYRKMNTLQAQGRGGWMILRSPVRIGKVLVVVLVRVAKEE